MTTEGTTENPSVDDMLYLPGGDSESEYAVVPKSSTSCAPRFPPSSAADSSTDIYVNVEMLKNGPEGKVDLEDPDKALIHKDSDAEPVESAASCDASDQQRITRSETFEYGEVAFIGDVLRREEGSKDGQESDRPAGEGDIKYGELELSPPSQGVIGEKGDTVYDEVAHELSPLAASSPLTQEVAARRKNPFLSPLQPFTAAGGNNSAIADSWIYKSLDGESRVTKDAYDPVVFTEDSGLYESIEAPPSRKQAQKENEELDKTEGEEEGIYELVRPPKSSMQASQPAEGERSGTPMSEVSEVSSFDSDEIVEEVNESSELHLSFKMSTMDQERHVLLPKFLLMEKKQRQIEQQGSFVLASSPYLNRAEQQAVMESIDHKRPAILPPRPKVLDRMETKRYLILETIIRSETSYVESLKRLVENYAQPLLSATGRLLSKEKVDKIFYKIQDIWVHHRMFLVTLSDRVSQWNPFTKIGDIFEGSFARQMVLNDYIAFVNNFESAMETLNQAKHDNSSFQKFLKDCQSRFPDKLDIKSLILKPIQRFPQFICCLQDMVKHTPSGHPDRFPLQMALTQLEFVASTLNEQKRAIESYLCVRDIEKRMVDLEESIQAPGRGFVQQDFVQQQVIKKGQLANRTCCLFLLSDVLICASLVKSESHKPASSFACKGKYKFKWMVPLSNVHVVDVDYAVLKKKEMMKRRSRYHPDEGGLDAAYDELRQKQTNLLHDFDIVSQIASLVSCLKLKYKILDDKKVKQWCKQLQINMVDVDKKVIAQQGSRLDLLVPTPRNDESVCTFLMQSPEAKAKLITAIHIALIKKTKQNNPGWLRVDANDDEDTDEASVAETRSLPLFLTNLHACPTAMNIKMCCAAISRVLAPPLLGYSTGPCIWVCSYDEKEDSGLVSIFIDSKPYPRVLESFSACMSEPLCIAPVLLQDTTGGRYNFTPTMWIGTRSEGVVLFDAQMNRSERKPLLQLPFHVSVRSIASTGGRVYVGLGSGTLTVFSAERMCQIVEQVPDERCSGSLARQADMNLSLQAVNCIVVVGDEVWCASGCTIYIISDETLTIKDIIEVDAAEMVVIHTMVGVGSGLWLALSNSPTVRLYYTETRQFVQEVAVNRTIHSLDPGYFKRQSESSSRSTRAVTCNVTCLFAAHGHLLVGTSCGHIVGLPIAQLEGIPKTSGKAVLSVHHFNDSAVRFLVSNDNQIHLSGNLRKASTMSQNSSCYIDLIAMQRKEDEQKDDDQRLKSGADKEQQAEICQAGEQESSESESREHELKTGATVEISSASSDEQEHKDATTTDKELNEGYEAPWDFVNKQRAKSPVVNLEDDLYGLIQSRSFSCAKLSDDQTSIKIRYQLLMAGGDTYKWGDNVADDGQVIMWRINY